ncbi:MAG: protein phosphatase 2C domain-containing protein [Saprospiraceae bacterium]|nr:protein phosphatase 2C domain-containing protein [Saprospiraceae bacterium]
MILVENGKTGFLLAKLNARTMTSLIVGIVADGVGSADFGARGAQLVIDTVLKRLEKSEGNDIPAVIELAIQAANIAVFRDNQKNDGDGLTTLVVCVIFNERCYVGNVGDSRAYWLQANPNKTGKVLQLTRDHSYFNIYGGDPNSQEAGILVNAIGKKEQVQVDCGFYLKGDDFNQAYQLGLKGCRLSRGIQYYYAQMACLRVVRLGILTYSLKKCLTHVRLNLNLIWRL